MKRILTVLSLVVLVWYSCKSTNMANLSEVNQTPLEPRFLNKIVTLMQNGHPVPPSGDIPLYDGKGVKTIKFNDLKGKTPNEVFDILSKSVHFADTLLQYNLYFLGRNTDTLKTPNTYVEPGQGGPEPELAPPDSEGSYTVNVPLDDQNDLNNADDLNNSNNSNNLNNSNGSSNPNGGNQPMVQEPNQQPAPIRQTIRYRYPRDVLNYPQAVYSAYETFRGGDFFTLFSGRPASFIDWPVANEAERLEETVRTLKEKIYKATLQGSAASICIALREASNFNSDSPVMRLYLESSRNFIPECQRVNNVAQIKSVAQKMNQLVDHIFSQRMQYLKNQPSQFLSLVDFQMIPASEKSSFKLTNPIAGETWQLLPNTITNANRKRASYLLKTYFCDDILPVKIEPSEMNKHAKNKHLSDPACASCHYKLDPIGGLFRYIGSFGRDQSQQDPQNGFAFDGGGFMTASGYRQYLQTNWPRDINGQVKLGYYESPNKRHPAWRGDTLEDFWTFLPKVDKVKQCYVQRLTESILGIDQAIDEKWIVKLASQITPGPNSGKQVLNVIKEIYFSNANRESNRDTNVCYDRVVSNSEMDFIPCKIQSILNRKCKSCHTDSSAELNLTAVQKFKSDRPWFVHGGKTTVAESASEIMSRLNERNKDLAMPQGAEQLTDTEKSLLERWLVNNGAVVK